MKQIKYIPRCKRHRAKPSNKRKVYYSRGESVSGTDFEEPVRATDGEVFNLRYWRNLTGHIEDVVMISGFSFMWLSVLFFQEALWAAYIVLSAAVIFLWTCTGQPFLIIAKKRATLHPIWKFQLPLALALAGLAFGRFLSTTGRESEIAIVSLLVSGVIGGLSFTKRLFVKKSLVYMIVSLISLSAIATAPLLGIWEPGKIYVSFLLLAAATFCGIMYAFGSLRANYEHADTYIENGYHLEPRILV